MSEPATQPPVPKPRVNRPFTSPTDQDSENLRSQSSQEGQESSRTPSPTPKPTTQSTAGELNTTANEEDTPENGSSRDDDVRHKLEQRNHHDDDEYVEYDEQDDGDYENIDAMLDEDEQKQVRRSDYLNWVYVDSDEDDGGGRSPLAGRNPPSVKLHNHPALKKSQSSHDMESPSLMDALALKKQFEQHLQNLKSSKEGGARPKNRAPPPPPGSKQRGDRSPKVNRNSSSAALQPVQAQAGSERGHKRSQSDVHVIDYSERDHAEGRSRGQAEEGRSRGQAEEGKGDGPQASAGSGRQQGQKSPRIHSKNPHAYPHLNKPSDPVPQFQRKHSPQRLQNSTQDGRPPPPTYAPPPVPSAASATGRLSSGAAESAQKTPPTVSGLQQPSRRPNPPRTAGQRGQSAATGADKAGKDKERNRIYAVSNNRHPPPPPNPSSTAATSTVSSSSATASVDDPKGRGNRPQHGEDRVYDRSPKMRGRHGAEKVYELLSKARTDRERDKAGHSPVLDRQTSASGDGASVYAKPKRHAPPPPSGGGPTSGKKGAGSSSIEIPEGPPDYSAVMSSKEGKQESQSEAASVDTRPPKPLRQRRTRSIEDLSLVGLESVVQTGNETDRSSEVSATGVLSNMEVFTIDLRRDGDHSLGLVIVSGKARSSNSDVIEGVFVQKVLPGSLAEKDGRIQSGDMLVEVADQNMVGGALDRAIELLQEPRESIRLKVGRPDLTSSVFAVQGGEEQPIYENETLERISPTERDLMIKLEKSQMKVIELEGEKEKVEKELKAQKEKARRDEQALRQQIKELQEMLDSKKAEKETTVLELTQTLATVTVEKTKVERALEERKNEVETLRQQLSDVTRDKASVDDILKETNLKLQETEDELAQIKTEKSTLWTELVSGRERISDLEEKLKAAETNNATLLETIREQAEEISSLKAELGRPSEIPRQPPPLPIESASKLPPALPPKEKEPSPGDDDAFEDREPSPVAPCPYLSFVPLQDDPRARHKKGKDSEGEKQKKLASESSKKEAGEEQTLPSKEATDALAPSEHLNKPTETVDERLTEATVVSGGDGGQATAVEGEQDQREVGHQVDSEEPAVPLPDLDVVKPLQKLDSRAALHKSQVGGQIKRKKPSRDLLRQMGSSSNLLNSIPDEQQQAHKLSAPPSSTQPGLQDKEKEKEKEAKEAEIIDKDEPSSKQQSVPDEHAPTATVAQPPKPKPRAAPRKKNAEPTSPNADGGKSLPQAVPRQKSVERELSPLHDSDKSGRDISSNEAVSDISSVDDHASQRKEPILPSPVMVSKGSHSPKHHTGADKEHGSNENEEHTPKPLPRGHAKTGKDDESSSQAATNEGKIAELMSKDPSELTVKEKALLAQRTVGALGHDKMKPPPIPRKPKPTHASGGEGDTPAITVDGERGRSHSIDEKENNPSPLHGRRKLPPGAVNIMAGLAMSAERGRCNTVSTTEPDVRERNSLERNASLQDYSQENGVKSSSQEPLEQTDHSTPTKPLPKAPPKRPPLPVQKKPSNEKPQNTESVDKENDTSPPLARKGDITDNIDGEETVQDESPDQSHDAGEGGVDLNTVLTWNPEVVGLWLNSVGLGQYKDLFVGVQGYMLFDMDGHRLKGLGMSSHDDRNLFKKEIKNLKPYADKHKKVLDKQRKEEKKIAKKKKGK